MPDYHQYIENEVAALRVAYAAYLDNGKEKDSMANCKLCGGPVRSAPVFHPACWEKAAHELAEKFCNDFCRWPAECKDSESLAELHCDEQTILAIAAGAYAIDINKRLRGATHMWDIHGVKGGPKTISYHDACCRLYQIADSALEPKQRKPYVKPTVEIITEGDSSNA